MKTNLDGSVEYNSQDDTFSEVKLQGVSVLGLTVLEAKVYPDGYGYVLTRKRYGDAAKILLDTYPALYSDGTDADEHYYTNNININNNWFYHGRIEVTL
jgi:hypothetical protein